MRCERRSIWVIGISLCGLVALGPGSVVVTGQNGASALRDLADRRGFVIGAPMGGIPWNQGPQYRTVFAREFNSGIVFVFPKLTQPERGRFQFRGMDVLAQFGREHKEKLFGVTLVYRNPTSPAWLRFDQRNCGGWSPAELDQIMKTQIQAVVEHGGDAFSIWEPIDEPLGYGGGCWERILGRDALIAHAFTYAKQANPHAQLLLNETFGHRGLDAGRVDAFFEIVRNQKVAGTPIDAVGTEMHLEAPLRPNYLEEFRYFLAQARRAGVRAYVTEMDVYQGPPRARG